MFVFYLVTAAIVVVLYAYFFGVAIKSIGKVETTDEYFMFGRQLEAGSVFSTLYAAEMSIATVFIAFFELAFSLNYLLLAAIGTFVLGQSVLWLALPRIKEVNSSTMTLPAALGARYDSRLMRFIALVVIVIGFGGLFATEIIVGSELFRFLVDNKELYGAGVFAIATLVVVYTLMGGFRNILLTDNVQTSLIFVAITVLFIVAMTFYSQESTAHRVAPLNLNTVLSAWPFILNLAVINIAYPLVDMAAWHRIAAAKDIPSGRKGFGTGVGMFLLSWTAILFSAIVITQVVGKGGAAGLVEGLRCMRIRRCGQLFSQASDLDVYLLRFCLQEISFLSLRRRQSTTMVSRLFAKGRITAMVK